MDVVRYRGRNKAQPPKRRKRGTFVAVLAPATVAVAVAVVLSVLIIRSFTSPAPQVMARLSGRDITLEDLGAEARAQGVTLNTTSQPRLLDAVITRRLLAEEARRRGLQRARNYPSDRRRWDDQLLVNALMRRWPPAPTPPTSQVQAFISGHPDAFAQRRRYTLLELRFGETAAPEVKDLPFDQVAGWLSAHNVPVEATQLVVIGSDAPTPLRRSLASAQEGDKIELHLDGGVTLLDVESVDAAPVTGPAAEMAAAAAILADARQQEMAQFVRTLRQRASLLISQRWRTAPRPAGERR